MEYLIIVIALFFTLWILEFVIGMIKLISQVIFFPVKIFIDLFFAKRRLPPSRPPPSPLPIKDYESKVVEDIEEKGYASNWSWIARDFKIRANWSCQRCYLYLGATKETKNLLHVHHINRNPSDNSNQNLVALCIQCHSSEPGSGHKRIATASKKDGRWAEIDRLRSVQRKI